MNVHSRHTIIGQRSQIPQAVFAAGLMGIVIFVSMTAFGRDASVGPDDVLEVSDAGVPTQDEMDAVLKEAIKKVAVQKNKEGKRELKKHRYPKALALFKEAYDLDAQHPEIVNNLGYIYYLLGNEVEAESLYRESLALDPKRVVAYLNLADLLAEQTVNPQKYKEAAKLLVSVREIKGNVPKVILRQARVAVVQGDFLGAEKFYLEYLKKRKPSERLKLELGDFYRDLGRLKAALGWYRKVQGENLGKQAAGRIWEIEVEKQMKEFGWTSHVGVVPASARVLRNKGRIMLRNQKWDRAEALLREALALAPSFGEARIDLGDLLKQTGRYEKSELEYLRALVVAQGNAEIYARLGELYIDPKSGMKRFSEATVFFTRALDLRPDWTYLHYQLALTLRAVGNPKGALQHVERYLKSVYLEADRIKALKLKRSIELLNPKGGAEENGIAYENDMSQTAIRALVSAKVHLARGELNAAMAELRGLGDIDRGVAVLNMEGRILLSAGRMDEAQVAFASSLRKNEKQADIHEQLGITLENQKKIAAAKIHFERAKQLGSSAADFYLALIEVGDGEPSLFTWVDDLRNMSRLLKTQQRLRSFLKNEGESLYRLEAAALERRVSSRILVVLVLVGLSLVLVVILLSLFLWRRFGGIGLKRLIELHPETGPEVQRILSAIRHEVLKHNTMMLSGLVDSLGRGDDVAPKAAHLMESILGGDKDIAQRLNSYVEDLNRIGDANRKRLNLARKDEAMAPLIKGVGLLKRLAQSLGNLDAMSPNERLSLKKKLQAASQLLNVEGYEAVRGLLDELRVLKIERPFINSIFDRCLREPSFAGVKISPLEIQMTTDELCTVMMPRTSFEDIMINIFRNAIQSSIQYSADGTDNDCDIKVGFEVTLEQDAITGIERVVFLIKDRSRKQLTVEMLRGRYIEEGLGLTTDLVSRHDGTLDVIELAPPWSKSVVVKLPRAEEL